MRTTIPAKALNATDEAVASKLAEWDITAHAIYTGEAKKDDWAHDTWVIVLASKTAHERFDYCTGTGHRKLDVHGVTAVRMERARLGGNTGAARANLEHYEESLKHPVIPTSASVLYCLVLDAGAARETFADWCSNYGYDADSIKALKTYDACCDVAKQLSKVFSRGQIAELQTMLEDY